mmetsp:Transcript_8174/g.14679  ORF Transcript_8174/g.14679 Transcript_8174/m.14679 type:complete len:102 (+) Transcript_8174:204-509(+)
MTLYAAELSSPLVGSSKNVMEGFVINSAPMAVRFFCPPEMPLIISLPQRVFMHSVKPRDSIMSFTSPPISLSGTPWSLSLADMVNTSFGVSVANSASSCIT